MPLTERYSSCSGNGGVSLNADGSGWLNTWEGLKHKAMYTWHIWSESNTGLATSFLPSEQIPASHRSSKVCCAAPEAGLVSDWL